LAGSRKDYYDRWFRLLSLESWEAETQFARILDPYTLSQRVEEGVTVPIMEILTGTELPRFLPPDNPFSGGGPGKQPPPGEASAYADYSPPGMVRAFLMVGHSAADVSPGDQLILHRGDPCAKDALRAVVAHVESGLVAVSIRTPFYRVSGEDGAVHCQPVCQEDGQWYFDRLPFLKGHDVARQALFGFFSKADPSILHILITGEDATKAGASSSANHAADRGVNEPKEAQIMRRPARTDPLGASSLKKQGRSSATEVAWRLECDDLCFSEGVQAELNEEQEAAVKAALSNEPFHLIHGPPGTGKTRVLARLVRICLDLGERVLVACPTNVALDRLLISLIALGVKDFLRVGGSSNVSPEFIQAMQSAGIRSALLEELSAKAANSGEFLKAVRGKTLVGATAYQCAAHPLFLRQRFDRVIIDEAGQLDEPSSLGVLALGPRFVLGGDHLQLPPVVQVCSDADRGDCGLEQSLFERLLVSSQSSRVSRLRMQHRMNREIQDIPSRLFYDGTLYPSPEAAGRRLLIDPGVSNDAEINRILDPDLPVVFVNIEGTNIGKARPEEAMVASRIVKGLLASGVGAAEIGIITPYRLQQALIRRQLVDGRGGPAFTSVDTVDRFQGGEREVIILSLARSDGVTSFLADRKRLNVSLSRARSKLILLGHRPSLEEHPLFLSLLSGIERVNVNAPAP
jgi:DNA replication ATP-dependent helicase Dna2